MSDSLSPDRQETESAERATVPTAGQVERRTVLMARVSQACERQLLDEGVDFFSVQGESARHQLEGRVE